MKANIKISIQLEGFAPMEYSIIENDSNAETIFKLLEMVQAACKRTNEEEHLFDDNFMFNLDALKHTANELIPEKISSL